MSENDIINALGEFWFPENKRQKFVGKLIRKDSNIVLEAYIACVLIKGTDAFPGPMINGTVNGVKVTLISACRISSAGEFSSKKCNATFLPNEVIVGQHYKDSSILVAKIEAKYTDIENWLMRCPFAPGDPQETALVKITWQSPIVIQDDIGEISIECALEQTYTTVKRTEINNCSHVSFLFNKPTCLTDAQSKVFSFRNLLTYFAGENLDCYNIRFWDQKGVECLYVLNFQESITRFQELPYPITYSLIEPDFQNIWTQWTRFEAEQAPICNLYFEVISNYSRWSNQFLNLSQALEIFSCRLRDNSAKDLYEEEKQANPDKEYPDNTPFYFRLKDIFCFIQSIMGIEEDDVHLIATRIADTRNYYTHYSKGKERKAISIQLLPKANRFLRTSLTALVLRQIGVSENIIRRQLPSFPYGIRWNEVKTIIAAT